MQGRLSVWRAGKGFAERPVLGWGPENFLVAYGRHAAGYAAAAEAHDYAHNKPVEVAATTGAAGLAVWVALWGLAVPLRAARAMAPPEKALAVFASAAVAGHLTQLMLLFDTPAGLLISKPCCSPSRHGSKRRRSPNGGDCACRRCGAARRGNGARRASWAPRRCWRRLRASPPIGPYWPPPMRGTSTSGRFCPGHRRRRRRLPTPRQQLAPPDLRGAGASLAADSHRQSGRRHEAAGLGGPRGRRGGTHRARQLAHRTHPGAALQGRGGHRAQPRRRGAQAPGARARARAQP